MHAFTEQHCYKQLGVYEGEFLYKVKTKLQNKITQHDNTYFNALIQNISFKTKSTRRQKTSFPKETVENVDLHKAVLNKTMTTQEKCTKIQFRCLFKEVAVEKEIMCFIN